MLVSAQTVTLDKVDVNHNNELINNLKMQIPAAY